MEIWLVIPFFRKKFYAKQIFVLSSSMKLGPELGLSNALERFLYAGTVSSVLTEVDPHRYVAMIHTKIACTKKCDLF